MQLRHSYQYSSLVNALCHCMSLSSPLPPFSVVSRLKKMPLTVMGREGWGYLGRLLVEWGLLKPFAWKLIFLAFHAYSWRHFAGVYAWYPKILSARIVCLLTVTNATQHNLNGILSSGRELKTVMVRKEQRLTNNQMPQNKTVVLAA